MPSYKYVSINQYDLDRCESVSFYTMTCLFSFRKDSLTERFIISELLSHDKEILCKNRKITYHCRIPCNNGKIASINQRALKNERKLQNAKELRHKTGQKKAIKWKMQNSRNSRKLKNARGQNNLKDCRELPSE